MSIYQYQEPSKLEKIAVRKTPGGGARCFLFTREGVTGAEAEKIKNTLENANLSCVATDVNGRDCLEVRGCKSVALLEQILAPTGALKGKPTVDHSDNEKVKLGDWVRNNAVALYGIINVIADIGIIYYGRKKTQLNKIDAEIEAKLLGKTLDTVTPKSSRLDEFAGYSYSAGSVMFTLFGRGDKSDYHAKDIAAKLKQELEGRGITISDDSAANSFLRRAERQSLLRKSAGQLNKMGSDAGNIATGTAGGLILASSIKGKVPGDALLGATTLLSGYGAALVKEKPKDPKDPPANVLMEAKQWVQEKPNRLAGFGYAVSTLAHGYEAVKNFVQAKTKYGDHPQALKIAKRAHAARGTFAGLNLIGELFLATSSKGHGKGVKSANSIDDTAIAIVADAVVRQPKEQREQLIADLGRKFLANPDVLGGDPETLEAKLFERVHKLEDNPWLVRKSGVASVQPAVAGEGGGKKWAMDSMKPAQVQQKEKLPGFVPAIEKDRAQEIPKHLMH